MNNCFSPLNLAKIVLNQFDCNRTLLADISTPKCHRSFWFLHCLEMVADFMKSLSKSQSSSPFLTINCLLLRNFSRMGLTIFYSKLETHRLIAMTYVHNLCFGPLQLLFVLKNYTIKYLLRLKYYFFIQFHSSLMWKFHPIHHLWYH